MNATGKVVALAGGVGGAKLADGLARLLRDRLTVVVNTGDDFEHLGLHVSPDLDTMMYTLAGIANPETGWGLAGETWSFMGQIARFGGPTWFRLGDRDLATHVVRTERLRAGDTLTAVTTDLAQALGISARILPMSDDPVRTVVHSGERSLPFQEYFVRLRCEVPVARISFSGAEAARLNSALTDASELDAIIICPSNPYLSVDPILSVPEMRAWISSAGVPVLAVSPIVGGAAIKGPAAKIMRELGLVSSAASIAAHYRDLISALVVDEVDAGLQPAIEALGIKCLIAATVMRTAEDRVRLARECLTFAQMMAGSQSK